jgi:hypothetical protein
MLALCLTYVIAAVVVAVVPQSAVMAVGPVVLLLATLAADARWTGPLVRRPAPSS